MVMACEELRDFDDNGGIILECLVLLLVFYCLLILTEEYLMNLIDFIIQHFDISQQIGGMIIAFGSIIPELSTNMISSFSKGHVNLGLSTIMGSGTFDFTVWIAIAGITGAGKTLKVHKKSVARDYLTYVLSLALIALIMINGSVTILESGLLVLLLPGYIAAVIYFGDLHRHADEIPEEQGTQMEKIDRNREDSTLIEDSFPPVLHQFYEHNPATYIRSLIRKPIVWIYDHTIFQDWTKKWKVFIALCVITFYSFWYTRYIVFAVSRISWYLNIKEQLIGLTVICWGNNIGDMVNSGVAAQRGMATLAVASALTTQIFNILFSVGFPWFCSTMIQGTLEISDDDLYQSLLVVFIVVLLSFISISWTQMHINRKLSWSLTIIYIIFVVFEWIWIADLLNIRN